MALPDNRIRYPSAKIDFAADVGNVGQDHDTFPAPGQARYDHLRMALIGLLANQASHSAPTQFREGTLWFDLNTSEMKIRHNAAWVQFANAVALADNLTISEWYAATEAKLVGLAPEIVFSGASAANGVASITIPESVRTSLSATSRVFLHINGSLIDPNNCSLIGTPATSIKITGASLSVGDTFVASIRQISALTFIQASVVVL